MVGRKQLSIDRARPAVPCGRAFAAPRRTDAGDRCVYSCDSSPFRARRARRRCRAFTHNKTKLRIRAARVLDGTGQVLANATVVVTRGEHHRRSSLQPPSPPSRPRTFDAAARTDRRARAHRLALRYERTLRASRVDAGTGRLYAAENAYLTLMAGFTTVQSPGQPGDVELREAIARGTLPGRES